MTAAVLIHELADKGIRLSRSGDRLRIVAPKGKITVELRSLLVSRKPELLAALAKSPERCVLHFRLTDFLPMAWATVLGAPGLTANDLLQDLRDRYGPRLESTRLPTQ